MSVLPVIVVLLYPSLANDRRQTYYFFLRCILGWICIIVYLGFSTWTLCTTWPRASYRFWCHTGPKLPWGYSQCTARMVAARQMSLNLACKMLQTEPELFNMCHLRYNSEMQGENELISSEGQWSQEGWQASQTLWANGMRFQCNIYNIYKIFNDVHGFVVLLFAVLSDGVHGP